MQLSRAQKVTFVWLVKVESELSIFHFFVWPFCIYWKVDCLVMQPVNWSVRIRDVVVPPDETSIAEPSLPSIEKFASLKRRFKGKMSRTQFGFLRHASVRFKRNVNSSWEQSYA